MSVNSGKKRLKILKKGNITEELNEGYGNTYWDLNHDLSFGKIKSTSTYNNHAVRENIITNAAVDRTLVRDAES